MILKAQLKVAAEGVKKKGGDKGLVMDSETKKFQTAEHGGNEQQKPFTDPQLSEIRQLFDRLESDGHRTKSRHRNTTPCFYGYKKLQEQNQDYQEDIELSFRNINRLRNLPIDNLSI